MSNVTQLFERLPEAAWPFMRFWLEYPRKMDRVAATRAWAKLSDRDRAECLRRLPIIKRYWERSGTERRFIPYPATFLNSRRWEDEVEGEEAPATDLGQCFWNRNGNRDPHAGPCTERAVATDPSNGQVYCAKHGRSLGLRVKLAAGVAA